MLLDAQTFKTVLTPEAALGVVQKTVASKGWKQFDVSDVKLVYTPYWIFSFDVLAGEAAPTGKTALNAYTGELNDYVPYLLERPLKKAKETEEGEEADILPTAIQKSELTDVAATKVAAHAGIKKDAVSISAATKYYIPSFQVWVDAAGDSFKIDVDALLGNPQGAEAIPAKPKGWSEAASETVSKMKSPTGWIELIGKTLSALVGITKPGGEGAPKQLQSTPVRYALLILIVLVLGYFVFLRGGPAQGGVSCDLLPQYYNPPALFGLGAKTVKPSVTQQGLLHVDGTCSFTNPGPDDIPYIISVVKITSNGAAIAQNNTSVSLLPPTGNVPSVKTFSIDWTGSSIGQYSFDYCRLEKCR